MQGIVGVGKMVNGKYVHANTTENMIVDSGLELIGNVDADVASKYCLVGSDGTPTNAAMTTLLSRIGTASAYASGSSDVFGGTPGVDAYVSLIRTYTFALGAVTGNVAEIGFFDTSGTSRKMFSRMIPKDAEQTPVTIPISNEEQLVVTYELRAYLPPVVDTTMTIDLKGVPTVIPVKITPLTANSTVWSPGTNVVTTTNTYVQDSLITPVPGVSSGYLLGNREYVTNWSNPAYVPGSYERVKALTIPINLAAWPGGIQSMVIHSKYYIGFSIPIPKQAGDTLTIPFKWSWGRYGE
jgi:hypothetical protein